MTNWFLFIIGQKLITLLKMASCNPDRLYTEPSRPGQFPSSIHEQDLYHSESTTPAYCVPLADFLRMQSAVQDRMLSLETELTHAISERTAAEQVVQYMLKVAATGWRSPMNAAEHGQDLALQHEIASLKIMVADLRERLYEMTSLLIKASQQQAVTASDKNNLAPYETSLSCPTTSIETPYAASKKGVDFVDLLDMDGQVAEAHSDRGSSNDVDMEELAAYTLSPPRIDLSAPQKTIGQTTPSSSCLDVLPSTECSIVHRFMRNTSRSSAQIEAEERLFHSPEVCR